MRVASGLVLALSALALGRAIPPNECSHEVQDATQNQDAPLEKRGGCWPWGRNEVRAPPLPFRLQLMPSTLLVPSLGQHESAIRIKKG